MEARVGIEPGFARQLHPAERTHTESEASHQIKLEVSTSGVPAVVFILPSRREGKMEARVGIEPASTALQAAA